MLPAGFYSQELITIKLQGANSYNGVLFAGRSALNLAMSDIPSREVADSDQLIDSNHLHVSFKDEYRGLLEEHGIKMMCIMVFL